MATALSRSLENITLPPVSHAHQEGLRALVAQLQATGQDVTLLAQLAECLPRLRSGLTARERQQIEELDANENLFASALSNVHEAIDGFDCLVGATEHPLTLTALLVDPARLRQVAQAACSLAEAANELALRASSRSGLLE